MSNIPTQLLPLGQLPDKPRNTGQLVDLPSCKVDRRSNALLSTAIEVAERLPRINQPRPIKKSKRARKARNRKAHRRKARLQAQVADDADRVLSYGEFCALVGISEREMRRMIVDGRGPKLTMITERRIGVTRGNLRKWLERRERGEE
jgi:predicted DNA-binding transcriptional regulator AlpA